MAVLPEDCGAPKLILFLHFRVISEFIMEVWAPPGSDTTKDSQRQKDNGSRKAQGPDIFQNFLLASQGSC